MLQNLFFCGIIPHFLTNNNLASERLAEKRIKNMENQKKSGCSGGCDPKKHVKGVMCDVKNCAYHDGKCDCYAGSISVGPTEATCSANTACATFKPKEH